MSTILIEADVKVLVNTGTDSLTRVFDCLYLVVTAVIRSSYYSTHLSTWYEVAVKLKNGVYSKNDI